MAWVILQLLAFFALPALALRYAARLKLVAWLSPVVVLYALGVVAGNAGLPLRADVTEGVATAAVLLAIPLLVFGADFLGWLRLARTTAISCALSFGSVVLVTCLTAIPFAQRADEGWIVAGMLVGTYTGSAPNMAAVGQALGVKPETLVLVTTADLIVAGAFCFVLLSPAVRLLGSFLRPFPRDEGEPDGDGQAAAPTPSGFLLGGAGSLGLACVVVALAGGVSLLAGENAQQLVAILGATTLGVALSLSPRVRRLPASYTLGEYFILVFCVSFGTLADFQSLLASASSGVIMAWTALVMLGGVGLHLFLCRLLGIDRDTALITTTAAIYGPPLIGPVAANLKNPELVLSGLTAALCGLAVGNYLGVAVALGVRAASG